MCCRIWNRFGHVSILYFKVDLSQQQHNSQRESEKNTEKKAQLSSDISILYVISFDILKRTLQKRKISKTQKIYYFFPLDFYMFLLQTTFTNENDVPFSTDFIFFIPCMRHLMVKLREKKEKLFQLVFYIYFLFMHRLGVERKNLMEKQLNTVKDRRKKSQKRERELLR